MTEAYDGRQVVGMDLHRRRSVLVRMTEDGLARPHDRPPARHAAASYSAPRQGQRHAPPGPAARAPV